MKSNRHSLTNLLKASILLVFVLGFAGCSSSKASLGRAKSLWRYSEPEALNEARRVARSQRGPQAVEASKLAIRISLQLSPLHEIANDYKVYHSITKKHNWPLLEEYCKRLLQTEATGWMTESRINAMHASSQLQFAPTATASHAETFDAALNSDQLDYFKLGVSQYLSQGSSRSPEPLLSRLQQLLVKQKLSPDSTTMDKIEILAAAIFGSELKPISQQQNSVAAMASKLLTAKSVSLESRYLAYCCLQGKSKTLSPGEQLDQSLRQVFDQRCRLSGSTERVLSEFTLNAQTSHIIGLYESDTSRKTNEGISYLRQLLALIPDSRFHAEITQAKPADFSLAATQLVVDSLLERKVADPGSWTAILRDFGFRDAEIQRIVLKLTIQSMDKDAAIQLVSTSTDSTIALLALKRHLQLTEVPSADHFKLALKHPEFRYDVTAHYWRASEAFRQELLKYKDFPEFKTEIQDQVLSEPETLARIMVGNDEQLTDKAWVEELCQRGLSKRKLLPSNSFRNLLADKVLNHAAGTPNDRIYAAASLLKLSESATARSRKVVSR